MPSWRAWLMIHMTAEMRGERAEEKMKRAEGRNNHFEALFVGPEV